MAFEVPPTLTEVILSGPEVVIVERALATALEQSGLCTDDLAASTDPETLGVVPAVYARWDQQVRRLGSGSCGLSIDGHGLLVMSVFLADLSVVVMALKARLFDLSIRSLEEGGEEPDEEFKMITTVIVRLERLL